MDSTAKVFDSTTADNASRGFRGEGSARHGGVKGARAVAYWNTSGQVERPHAEPCAARNSRASSRRSSFPMADLGSASRNSTRFGTLYAARCRRQWSRTSSSVRPMPFRVTTDRKSTRLNSSHLVISYAVFCLKKKKNTQPRHERPSSQIDAQLL